MSALTKRLSLLLSVLSLLALVAAGALLYGWVQMRGSLPQLDGVQVVPGLSAPVKIARDALGVPVLSGATRADVARATGFVHAQDRFFQMDLLRRRGAGELAEIYGPAALDLDRSARLHGFRRVAEKVLARADPGERALLQAYTAGVNAGLSALGNTPWEYLVLRTPPQPWREEDSLLCVYAMWFDLQDSTGSFELTREAVRNALGPAALDFLAPRGDSWDAALDGSQFEPPAFPLLHFKAADGEPQSARVRFEAAQRDVTGSNAFAVAGAHTAAGAALLANDMHLGLAVPHIWYRAEFRWSDERGAHRLTGVTLPGTPNMIIGSNGRVAWGFTDAYVDTTDVVIAETDAIYQRQYRTTHGWVDIEDRTEEIKVKGGPAVAFTARWTEWGPIIAVSSIARSKVLRWTAHDAEATNLKVLALETATTAAEAVEIAHRSGIPNENIVIADADGHIAWTLIGLIPRRVGFDGRLPVSWAYGDRRWDGWLKPQEVPVVFDPPGGALWSANQRMLGGAGYAKLGDSGSDGGARAAQIRDDLRALVAAGKPAAPADLLAIELDDRARFLERWQKLLLEVLDDSAVAQKKSRAGLRDAVRRWDGRASVDSASYRLVRAFRAHTAERVFAPFAEAAEAEELRWEGFRFEDGLWRLVHERPAGLLNPAHPSWPALLLAAADDVLDDADQAGVTPERFTWGRRNLLAMRHPFSRFLPGILGRWLDMPAMPLPGDRDMPRVQGPAFGQSERLVVAPGHESDGLLTVPGGQSGHPLSPYYRAGHEAWVKGEAGPLLPGAPQHTLVLRP